jgi:hypothetical protein
MNATASRAPAQALQTNPETLAVVRQNVMELLTKSQAFLSLPPDKRKEIARQTVEVASYLAEPEGIRGNKLPTAAQAPKPRGSSDPYSFGLADDSPGSRRSGPPKEGEFRAQGAREGAEVAGALLENVNFGDFVGGLITKVFHAIVTSSIEQMEAYGRLVADVAKSLNQFRDENVSANQGRDHLVEQYPDLFKIDIDTGEEGGQPRVRLRDDVDESAAVRRVNSMPVEGGPLSSLDDETIEEKLVPAARTQLATSRQQLLATMVLMGINRIVVTDGKISAKVLYDFKARDTFKYQKTQTDMKYAKDAYGNLAKVGASESEGEVNSEGASRSYSSSEGSYNSDSRDGSYYAKGKYKYAEKPVITMASASTTSTDASLETKASLAGVVEVNFKSDYFPLEKMADSFQIGQIQNAAQPGQARAANAAQPANTAQQPAASTTAPAAAPAKA